MCGGGGGDGEVLNNKTLDEKQDCSTHSLWKIIRLRMTKLSQNMFSKWCERHTKDSLYYGTNLFRVEGWD